MSSKQIHDSHEDVAIVGMSGRFPGAENLESYWKNLRDGVTSISFFNEAELQAAGIAPALLENPNYVKARAALDDVDLFDAQFFGFTDREAELMDPQQRVFIECAWEALEEGGYDPETYPGRIGVYAGQSLNTYILNSYSYTNVTDSAELFQILIGNEKDHLPTRVSYKLNLKGPSINVQTACSTSLVAVVLACQNLLDYRCDMALAGGVSIQVPTKRGYLFQEGGILSPDGRCCAFDARAQGTVGGDGAGVVLLKRLEDALADGDNINAIIKGTAINNDGSAKVGYTAPGVDGQTEVIVEALAVAGIEAETIAYVEAHGTGTALGDPIEIDALTRAFRHQSQKKGFCAVGSVKTNIGHLDAAAGVAGLIKTVLSLKHRMLPPSLHFETPNPRIDFANSPFYVNTKLSEWRANGTPRRAGVSSFGIGGTNAHVILEEAPPLAVDTNSRSAHVLVLSARTPAALETAAKNLAAHLRKRPDLNLADVAYTLQVGRRVFEHRRAHVCTDHADALAALETSGQPECQTPSCDGVAPDVTTTSLESLARLWTAGVQIDWTTFHEGEQRRRVSLPTYPFERRRYWLEPKQNPPDSPSPEKISQGNEVAPAGQIEEMIAAIWREVLGLDRVGMHDDFFELGGNSLIGLQLMSRLRKLFVMDIPIAVLFDTPTIAELAANISDRQRLANDENNIEHLLQDIEQLSDVEVRSLLEQDFHRAKAR